MISIAASVENLVEMLLQLINGFLIPTFQIRYKGWYSVQLSDWFGIIRFI